MARQTKEGDRRTKPRSAFLKVRGLGHLWDKGGSVVKNPPAIQQTWVQSQGGKDLLEKEMATHSSILAWERQWTVEPGGLQPMRLQSQT